jgi:hypothetical protein
VYANIYVTGRVAVYLLTDRRGKGRAELSSLINSAVLSQFRRHYATFCFQLSLQKDM